MVATDWVSVENADATVDRMPLTMPAILPTQSDTAENADAIGSTIAFLIPFQIPETMPARPFQALLTAEVMEFQNPCNALTRPLTMLVIAFLIPFQILDARPVILLH